jgi:trimethylamine:corrinoid methyltransferase-like protein
VNEELLKQILDKLDHIESNMATKEDIARIEKKLDATFEQVAQSAETINEIAATQDRHERVLEILSKRSIEQESYIRRGK